MTVIKLKISYSKWEQVSKNILTADNLKILQLWLKN